MKKIIVVLSSLLVIAVFITIPTSSSNKANAIQGFCPPICLDQVNLHVKGAIKALDKADIPTAHAELNIVKSLLESNKRYDYS